MRGDRAVPRRGEIELADGRVLAYADGTQAEPDADGDPA